MDETAKFTPGPWTITRSKLAVDGASDYAISAEGAPVLAEAFGRDSKGGWPAADANAHLIAAAPELLSALKEIIRFVDSSGSEHINRVPFVRARAAIAKAEGRAS